MQKERTIFRTIALCIFLVAACGLAWPGPGWRVECPGATPRSPVVFGVNDLNAALARAEEAAADKQKPANPPRERVVRVALASNAEAMQLAKQAGATLSEKAESFVIAATDSAAGVGANSPSILILGRDANGAMYGCLELAERLDMDGLAALRLSEPIARAPFTEFRAISPFLTLPYGDETFDTWWFLSDDFWKGYLDQLARSRFNWIDLHGMCDDVSTTFPNIYPYFVQSESFPDAGVEPERAARHLTMLRKVLQMASERGIQIGLMSYSTQFGPGTRPNSYDWNDDNLALYNRECIRKLLLECPEIAMIGFRIGESGKEEDFFKKCYVQAVKDSGRNIPVATRTWGAKKGRILELAEAFPNRLRVEIKYNGEQLGPPYIIAGGRMAVWRDYSYQNYISAPRPYEVIHQVWPNGTHRVFPWGNPALVRTTVECARLGGAIGISLQPINTFFPARNYQAKPGSPGEWYHWVYQRDWLYYTLWGRLSYDPETPERVWIEKFRQRYGAAEGEEFYQAFTKASEIVPRAFTFAGLHPDHRCAAIELEIGGDLWMAARGDAPFDLMNVQAPIEFARRCVEKRPSARMSPMRCAEILDELASDTGNRLEKAKALREKAKKDAAGADAAARGAGEGKAAEDNRGTGDPREFDALCGDMEMLQNLARFHAARLRTATYFSLYVAGHDLAAEKAARACHADAVDSWRRLSILGEQYYKPFIDTLRMHTEQFTWWDEAQKCAQGGFPITSVLDPLNAEVMGRYPPAGYSLDILEPRGDRTGPSVEVVGEDLAEAVNGVRRLTVRARVADPAGVASVLLRWKPFPSESAWRTLPMTPSAGEYRAELNVYPYGIMWGIEALDADGNGKQWPDFMKEIPYHWIEPWNDPASFADAPAEVLASGQAADLARYRALVIGRDARQFPSLDAAAKAQILKAVEGGMLLYIDCQDFSRFPLDWLPGGLQGTTKSADKFALTPAHPIFEGLPGKLGANKIIAGSLTAADAEGWTLLGDPPALAIRRHGKGWIVVNQIQFFWRDPIGGWLDMGTFDALARITERIFALPNPPPDATLPVLVLDLGEGTIVDVLSCVNIRATLCEWPRQ